MRLQWNLCIKCISFPQILFFLTVYMLLSEVYTTENVLHQKSEVLHQRFDQATIKQAVLEFLVGFLYFSLWG